MQQKFASRETIYREPRPSPRNGLSGYGLVRLNNQTHAKLFSSFFVTRCNGYPNCLFYFIIKVLEQVKRAAKTFQYKLIDSVKKSESFIHRSIFSLET